MASNTETRVLKSVNPATLELIGETHTASEAEIKGKVDIARRAYASWSKLSIEERLVPVERLRKILLQRRHEVARLITRESGKPVIESLICEVFAVMETCAWLRKNAAKVLAREKVGINRLFFPFKKSYNVFEPLGVIGVISPWNFPLAIPASSILSALVAGNAVVLKPSPKTPLTAKLLHELLMEAGFPAGIVMLVQGDRDEARWLVESDIDRVVFTGSVAGGKAIMGMAAQKVHSVTLELGGKHPAIVLPDANIDKIVDNLVWLSFMNAGQACASIERLYVHDSLVEELVVKMVERVNRLRLGNPLHPDTDIGPVIDEGQLNRIDGMVKRAVEQGGRIAAGGRVRAGLGGRLPGGLPGWYMEPTIVTNVWHGMELAREEIFGPVVPVVSYRTVEEAVAAANNSHLGLGASIWTSNTKAGEQLARRIDSGMVWINDGIYSHACPDAPWGGVRASGFGRTHGKYGLLDFCNIKHIGVEGQGKRDWNFNYNTDRLEVVDKGIEVIHGKGIRERLGALLSMLPRLWRIRRNKDCR